MEDETRREFALTHLAMRTLTAEMHPIHVLWNSMLTKQVLANGEVIVGLCQFIDGLAEQLLGKQWFEWESEDSLRSYMARESLIPGEINHEWRYAEAPWHLRLRSQCPTMLRVKK